jgi:hypothetical protein
MSRRFSNLFSAGIALLLLALPNAASACSVCFGKSDSKLAEGMNWGIFTLLVVVFFVLAGITSFFVFIAKRSASVGDAAFATSNIPESTEKL